MIAKNSEQEQVARAMAALDAMATMWAAQFDIRAAVKAMMVLPDGEDRLIAFIKHAHAEGLYAGRMSHRDSPVSTPLEPTGKNGPNSRQFE